MTELNSILKYLKLNFDESQNELIKNLFNWMENDKINSSDFENLITVYFEDNSEIVTLLRAIYHLFKLDFYICDKYLNQLIVDGGYLSIIYFFKGIIKYQTNDYRNAVFNFRTALDLIQKNKRKFIELSGEIIYLKLGLSYIKTGDFDRADNILSEGCTKFDCSRDLIYLYANLKKFQKDHESEYLLLKELIKGDTNDAKIKERIEQLSNLIVVDQYTSPKISLCMIVKNEEQFLDGCLNSVYEMVDEIIIVDTGSVDNTVEIAKKYNSRIYHFDWIDDFASARNESLKYALGDWILYLDADERIKVTGKDYLKMLLGKMPEKIGGVICTIESYHTKPNGGSELHRGAYPRIFRNYKYPNICFTGKIHEQITPSIRELGKELAESDIIIEHLGYNRDNKVIQEKVMRNYKLLMDQVRNEPTNGYAWFQLGQTLGRMNLTQQAVEAFKFAIETRTLSDSIKSSAYSALAQMTGNLKQFKDCLFYAKKSLEFVPNQQYALHLKAYAELYLGYYEDSQKDFLQLIEMKSKSEIVPKTGFDIDIPIELIKSGYEKAKNRDNW